MVAITVVEPNTLLRLGLLKLLATLDSHVSSRGIDYTQLFDHGKPPPPRTPVKVTRFMAPP